MLLFGLLLCHLGDVLSYNFDVLHPIVHAYPAREMRTADVKRNYFGYTTIMYAGNGSEPWIQIGAPRGHTQRFASEHPGLVFKCGIKSSCELLTIDDEQDTIRKPGLSYLNRKDGGWMGGTMDIDTRHGIIVICAPRWSGFFSATVDRKEVRRIQNYMTGACYWSKIGDEKYRKLLPLALEANFTRKENDKSFYYFALGEAGVSLHLTKNKKEPEILIGAPGLFNWEGGTLIYQNISETNEVPFIPYVGFVDFGLLGMAVTSGYYLNRSEILYATASYKKNKYLGEVQIYKYDKEKYFGIQKIDVRQGLIMGEGFGISLASGDVNGDGYDDLFVGAPYCKLKSYNEGMVYIFYGGPKKKLQVFEESETITGASPGGQFGTTIAYLESFDLDRYGDLIVAAPYEDSGTGAIYIYRGSSNGLITIPCQVIKGKNILPNLKGFGISLSNVQDIDNNGYKDISVGAYRSGHAVILRAKPIIHLNQFVRVWERKFSLEATSMQVCMWYEGQNLPNSIDVVRTIEIDRRLKRATLQDPNDKTAQEKLLKNELLCKNYTVVVKEQINQEIPVNIVINQTLAERNETHSPYVVNAGGEDTFCSSCPVMAYYAPLEVDIPFVLGCGDDNVCEVQLNLDITFDGLEDDSTYIIGSSDDITMNVRVSNVGEKAYNTKVVLKLPPNVFLRFTPKVCHERNSTTGEIECDVGNPLIDKMKPVDFLALKLNMDGVTTQQTLSQMLFNVSVVTSSVNLNEKTHVTFVLPLKSQADILLTGKSNQVSYAFAEDSRDNETFSQIYQIQKIGKSSVEEVSLNISIPYKKDGVEFLKLYSLTGSLAGQSMICRKLTNINDIMEIVDTNSQSADIDEDFLPPPPPILQAETTTENKMLLRRRRQVKINEINGVDVFYSSNKNESEALKTGKTLSLACDAEGIECAVIKCTGGPFKSERHVGVVQFRAFLNVSALKQTVILDTMDKIYVVTDGEVAAQDFNQTGDLADSVSVETVFLKNVTKKPVDLWIIFLAIAVALLILLLLVLTLIKAGFFNRKKKEELEALKKAEAESEFLYTQHKEKQKDEAQSDEMSMEKVDIDVECKEEKPTQGVM